MSWTNALQGVAIGDAFGVGVENKCRKWIKENVDFTRYVNVWKNGVNNISPGTYSDDTEHTVAMCHALLSGKKFTSELLLDEFKKEYEKKKNEKGFPRDGHGSIKDWYTGKSTIEDIRKEQNSRTEPGNAPVMRAFPLAFLTNDEDVASYCKVNADCTHPHPLSTAASYLTVQTIRFFFFLHQKEETLFEFLARKIKENVYNDEFDIADILERLEKVDALPHPMHLKEEDYVVLHGPQPLPRYCKWITEDIYGLPCSGIKTALNIAYLAKYTWNAPFEALQQSILMGGDVDSLAAITVGIACGMQGFENIPEFIMQSTEGLKELEDLGKQLRAMPIVGGNREINFFKAKYSTFPNTLRTRVPRILYLEGITTSAVKNDFGRKMVEIINAKDAKDQDNLFFHCTFVPEPVDVWKSMNIHQEMIADPVAKTFEFQLTTLLTRLCQLQKTLRETTEKVMISRSLFVDCEIFAKVNVEMKRISPEKYAQFMEIWTEIKALVESHSCAFIYLDLFDAKIENVGQSGLKTISEIDKKYIQAHRKVFPAQKGTWKDHGQYVRVEAIPETMTNEFVFGILSHIQRPFY
jgi:ADP-ribosylglycohydrolase